MRIELDESIVKLGERIAQSADATDKLRNFITSAVATLQDDDLSSSDTWENLIHDLECGLAVAHALAANVE